MNLDLEFFDSYRLKESPDVSKLVKAQVSQYGKKFQIDLT